MQGTLVPLTGVQPANNHPSRGPPVNRQPGSCEVVAIVSTWKPASSHGYAGRKKSPHMAQQYAGVAWAGAVDRRFATDPGVAFYPRGSPW